MAWWLLKTKTTIYIMELLTRIISVIIICSFFVHPYPRINYLRKKGYIKVAEFIEGFIMILAIICQWAWYIGFGLLIFYIIKAIF